jgi:hypothetical protein
MAAEGLRYDRMIDAAFRGVVRLALTEAAADGLPGDHHFYLTFRTDHPGVEIAPSLRAQYPQEMTVVLQYQFYGLEVDDERFAVTLSFGGVRERLSVPFAAITTFADPSVNFALQFQPIEAAEGDAEAVPPPSDEPGDADDDEPKRGQVVALDAFRKKT